ncbi:MAG TPA: hypothetical protein VMV94_01105 [Phycisphaerae bacterium]|nr:hypothetical protein [Phycisphaerae bacterium]
MRAAASDREWCHKSGVILTCYVDGRKRFRAVPLDSAASPGEPADQAVRESDGARAEQAPLGARRFRRPN